MDHTHELHYVVVMKGDHICYAEAGPFISYELAQAAILNLPEISRSCRYALATQEVHLTVNR